MKRKLFVDNFTLQSVNKSIVNVWVPKNKNLVVNLALKTAQFSSKKWSGDWNEFIAQFCLVT